MNDRKSLAIFEMKKAKFAAQGGVCPVCLGMVSVGDGELAHKIPQKRWCLAKWGPEIIYHSKNMDLTHRGTCNSKVSLTNHPVAMEHLAAEIAEELRREKE